MAEFTPPTSEKLKERHDLAVAAFKAAGGTIEPPSKTDSPLTCDELMGASTMAYSYATTALTEGYGDEYVAYYSGLGQAYFTVWESECTL